MKYVLLFSGGLDSTTALYWLKSLGHEVRCLSIDYGQRHRKELSAAKKIAARVNAPFHILDLSAARFLLSGSSQTSELEVPEGHYTEESMKLTIVPNRNMIMLSMAIGWAINLGYGGVAYAAHNGDHAIYPDCRKEFIEAMQTSAKLCDWHSIDILAPFVDFSKSEIVKLGAELKVPFELTWSCYKGEDLHCGKCGTCVERKEAFDLSQISDPTFYEIPGKISVSL
ncbi:MAG: exsB protein [Bacteriovoracaceae bacterium]|nr:exsB protein [Bacteriovoracaceae bacterium]